LIDGVFIFWKDFNPADDTFFIDASLVPGLPLGALDPSRFVLDKAAADADDRIIYDQPSGSLWFDGDGNGNGAAIEFGKISPGLDLTTLDFIIV